MGRFTTPRRIGSTGWMMHAASRSAWNNRGSNAAYRKEREMSSKATFWLFLIISSPLLVVGLLFAFASLMTGSWLFFFFGPISAAWIGFLTYLSTW